jgi:hypothetical protein
VGHRTGLDDMEKRKLLTLRGLELIPLCRPALSQSDVKGKSKAITITGRRGL